LVREVEKTHEVAFDPNEELVTKLIAVSELVDLIRSGKITHSLAMNAIFHLLLKLGKAPKFSP
jgi:Asp-tRNA(Asn)/Glu-tRNA(Gln) amidotransferase B subunit